MNSVHTYTTNNLKEFWVTRNSMAERVTVNPIDMGRRDMPYICARDTLPAAQTALRYPKACVWSYSASDENVEDHGYVMGSFRP